MIEAVLDQYRIETYDTDKLGLWNYEDYIIGELYISNGTLLEEYCDGDLSKTW